MVALPDGVTVKAPVRDLTDQRFGRLVAIRVVGKSDARSLVWLCRCDCGAEVERAASSFRPGKVASCGCFLREKNKAHMLTIGAWNGGLTYSNKGPDEEYRNRKAWASAVIRERGPACEVCGWNEARCDAHHRVPRSKGGKNTVANGIVLCPNHHRISHERGHLHGVSVS